MATGLPESQLEFWSTTSAGSQEVAGETCQDITIGKGDCKVHALLLNTCQLL
jgi:hypothetical protein